MQDSAFVAVFFVNVLRSFTSQSGVVGRFRLFCVHPGPNQFDVSLLTVCYHARIGMSCRLRNSHYGLIPAKVIVFQHCVVAYTFDLMATHCVRLVDYSLPGLHLSLKNDHSLTWWRILLLFVGLVIKCEGIKLSSRMLKVHVSCSPEPTVVCKRLQIGRNG